MGYGARRGEGDGVKNGRLNLLMACWERRTCFTSESINSSFCFICARRYSRLLKGENKHSSSSEEGAENEEVRERAGIGISGRAGMKRGGKDTDFSKGGRVHKNGRHCGGGRGSLTLAHSSVFGLRQYSRACQICSACTHSPQAESNISSDGELELSKAGPTSARRSVMYQWARRTHFETLAVGARSGTE